MTQDTRKDKRAKVVSLNVRYKSATVDEFIENHSHDVSKGGIFVKTPTPFPPGTLLKFEIRLAGDKSVISGVGRVVWKREPAQAASDKPAGMGVKFIKLDDASRAVIEKLVAQKSDAGSAYTSDPAALEDDKPAAAPTTLRGLVAATPSEAPGAGGPSVSPSVSVPPPGKGFGSKTLAGPGAPKVPAQTLGAPAAAPSRPAANRPATALGMGPAPTAPVAAAPAAPPPAPKSEPRGGNPPPGAAPKPPPTPRKQTMMGVGSPPTASAPSADKADKHELPTLNTDIPPVGLGGVGHSSGAAVSQEAPAKAAGEPMFPVADKNQPQEVVSDPTMMKQAAELLEEALREAGGSLDEIGQNPLFSQSSQRGGKVEEAKPKAATPVIAPVVSPKPTPEPTPAKAISTPPPASKAEPPKPLLSTIAGEEKKKGGAGLVIGVLVAVAAIGGGALAFKSGAFGGGNASTTPAPSVSSSANLASASAVVPTESAPTASAPASAAAVLTATPAVTTDAGAAVAASASAVVTAEPVATTHPATAATAAATAKAVAAPPVVRPVAAPRPAQPRPMPAPTATDPDRETTPPEPKATATATEEKAPPKEAPTAAPKEKEPSSEAPAPAPTPAAPKEAPEN